MSLTTQIASAITALESQDILGTPFVYGAVTGVCLFDDDNSLDMRDAGYRQNRRARASATKAQFTTAPEPNTEITIDGVVWLIDEIRDPAGTDWEMELIAPTS